MRHAGSRDTSNSDALRETAEQCLHRLQMAAHATSENCDILVPELRRLELRHNVECLCTLAECNGLKIDKEMQDTVMKRLDHLSGLLDRVEYWIQACQHAVCSIPPALHKDEVDQQLRDVAKDLEAFATQDTCQKLEDKVNQIAAASQELAEKMDNALHRAVGDSMQTDASRGPSPRPDSFLSDASQETTPRQGSIMHIALERPEIVTMVVVELHKQSADWQCDVPEGIQHADLLRTHAQQLATEHQLAVVGMAGLGKTRFACALLETVRHKFSRCIFVPVGVNAKPAQLLRRVWNDLFPGWQPPVNAGHNLAHQIAVRLQQEQERVLLVLDNVWSREALQLLNFAQLQRQRQRDNRVIITTRDPGILGAAEHWSVVKLPWLTDEAAESLLISRAFRRQPYSKEYEEVVRQVVNKAEGVPLMLELIGGLLTDEAVPKWLAVIQQLEASERLAPSECVAASKEVADVTAKLLVYLQTTVDVLPIMTRRCFAAMAAFPRGSQVAVSTFIAVLQRVCPFQSTGTFTWARQQLYTLQSKFLLTISKQGDQDVVTVPDMLWEAAHMQTVCTHNTFHFSPGTCSPLQDRIDTTAQIVLLHRFLTQTASISAPCAKMIAVQGRSLFGVAGRMSGHGASSPSSPHRHMSVRHLAFQYCSHVPLPPLHQLLLLQHLEIKFCWTLKELPEAIGKLVQLQRISLRFCVKLAKLPDGIGKLIHLQHMDLKGCEELRQLPETAGGMTSLQHLDLTGCRKLERLPDSIWNLRALKQMKLAECLQELYGDQHSEGNGGDGKSGGGGGGGGGGREGGGGRGGEGGSGALACEQGETEHEDCQACGGGGGGEACEQGETEHEDCQAGAGGGGGEACEQGEDCQACERPPLHSEPSHPDFYHVCPPTSAV